MAGATVTSSCGSSLSYSLLAAAGPSRSTSLPRCLSMTPQAWCHQVARQLSAGILDHDLIASSVSLSGRSPVRVGVLSATAPYFFAALSRPYLRGRTGALTDQEITMFEPQFAGAPPFEWGPAHLREDAVRPDIEPADRPDDN